ncbi:Gfo/Idh/MocA family oxidoreductase [Paenibacillus sp. IB182496]|uniref:Gfo/Idh/MocA family oxidoreductase n=1 Tax=Paenibacillus sabuli TaxID=2772509 RepID=A0A927BNI6_9BACL|nr:Gfo/Idh/MocA family oxidoreductase [Paenibacillus sabuli]MBD2843807.1 Gfo/Idh/MocA family oxidoreductase [Paenibacillus sabuli]
MSKIGIGVLGLGKRGIYFAGDYFGKHPDCVIAGLCDLDPQRIAEARHVLGDVPATDRLDEFLALPGVDVVVICTPDPVHAAHTLAALQARKHIYLEKPMAQTIEDCDRMIEAAQEAGVVFMVGLELRYCTLFQDMKQLIDDGAIGTIKTGHVVDNVSVGGNYYYHGLRRKKDYVKSLMLEKGTHSLDLINWMVGGAPVNVFSAGGLDVFGGDASNEKRCRDCDEADTCAYYVDYFKGQAMDYGRARVKDDLCVYAEEIDTHDNSLAIIEYDNGARISFMECMFTPEYSREFTFVGTEGKMYGFYNNEQHFKIVVQRRHSRKQEVYYPKQVQGGHGGGDTNIVRQFVRYIQAGAAEMPGVEGARDSAAIAIAAAQSCETGLPVPIPLRREAVKKA